MKRISLIFLQCFCFSLLHAQSKDFFKDSVLVVTYTKTNFKSNQKIPVDMKMIIDSNVSYFFISNPQFKIEENDKIPSIIKYADSGYLLFNSPMMPKYNRFTFFSDSLHPMRWKLENKAEIINGLEGYMATTTFRGRHFTAFYDPKIPFQYGPYKFGGLPGLIIKFYDKDQIFHFELKSISKEKRSFKVSQINYAGDYKLWRTIKPEWQRKMDEKELAEQSTDPNCPTCGVKVKRYTIEIIEGVDTE